MRCSGGGIYDHLGGGFHRYSTDNEWLVPHFEKMLYDNALLLPALLDAWLVTGRSDFRTTINETVDYVLREMTQPQWGFFSTQDADSEGVEGKYFVWQHNEVLEKLGQDLGQKFVRVYGLSAGGNWEGQNILSRRSSWQAVADEFGIDERSLQAEMLEARRRLRQVRDARVRPGRDEKVLTSWNGMMISALAQVGRALPRQDAIAAACQAAEFIENEMTDANGRPLHSFKDGRARFTGCLDDYACLADGLLELFQTTQQPVWLQRAVKLCDLAIEHFGDPQGGFYFTADDHERLITRSKDCQDNAVPSGNGLLAGVLLRLARLTDRPEFERCAVETLEHFSGFLKRAPMAAALSLSALDDWLGEPVEIVVNGPDSDGLRNWCDEVARRFLPGSIVVDASRTSAETLLAGLLQGKQAARNQFFLCQSGVCRQPESETGVIVQQLDRLARPAGSDRR